ncbi:hypothetical protein KC342_g36 [Hortaea werneckii]|nr:hypothetical protein KC342_g36 [Hortaea werneckii]
MLKLLSRSQLRQSLKTASDRRQHAKPVTRHCRRKHTAAGETTPAGTSTSNGWLIFGAKLPFALAPNSQKLPACDPSFQTIQRSDIQIVSIRVPFLLHPPG